MDTDRGCFSTNRGFFSTNRGFFLAPKHRYHYLFQHFVNDAGRASLPQVFKNNARHPAPGTSHGAVAINSSWGLRKQGGPATCSLGAPQGNAMGKTQGNAMGKTCAFCHFLQMGCPCTVTTLPQRGKSLRATLQPLGIKNYQWQLDAL